LTRRKGERAFLVWPPQRGKISAAPENEINAKARADRVWERKKKRSLSGNRLARRREENTSSPKRGLRNERRGGEGRGEPKAKVKGGSTRK